MEKEKNKDVTKNLQDLVKKKKIGIVVIKAGSIKTTTSNSDGSSIDYYPSQSTE